MTYGIQFEQGEIIVVPFPFSNLSGIKQRPVLVISHENYNKESLEIITCGITSNLKSESYSILVTNQNMENGNIPKVSKIKVDKIFTLDKSIVKKRLGKVTEETFDRVKKEFFKMV